MCFISVYLPHGFNTGLYCSVEERAIPTCPLQRLAAVGMRSKWNYFLMFLYSLSGKLLIG